MLSEKKTRNAKGSRWPHPYRGSSRERRKGEGRQCWHSLVIGHSSVGIGRPTLLMARLSLAGEQRFLNGGRPPLAGKRRFLVAGRSSLVIEQPFAVAGWSSPVTEQPCVVVGWPSVASPTLFRADRPCARTTPGRPAARPYHTGPTGRAPVPHRADRPCARATPGRPAVRPSRPRPKID